MPERYTTSRWGGEEKDDNFDVICLFEKIGFQVRGIGGGEREGDYRSFQANANCEFDWSLQN